LQAKFNKKASLKIKNNKFKINERFFNFSSSNSNDSILHIKQIQARKKISHLKTDKFNITKKQGVYFCKILEYLVFNKTIRYLKEKIAK
jgi:hypothetical protein